MTRAQAGPKYRLEGRAAFCLLALVLVQFLPVWARGLTPFWGDLTYLHHAWRALPAQVIQTGRAPLWNPYLYFGIPMAAQMQGSLFFPATLPYYFFGFATATAIFHGLLYWLSGWFMFLWLRRLGLRRFSCLAGAAAYAMGGSLLSRVSFLNHLAVLSFFPAFLLFFDRPILLALSLAMAFFAGYPPFIIGGTACAWFLALLLAQANRRRGAWRREAAGVSGVWALAGAAAMVIGGCLLFPAFELALECRRTGGMSLDETLQFGFGPRDLVQWVSPVLVPWSRFDPGVEWWKACYIGFVGSAAAALGLFSIKKRIAAGIALLLVFTLLLILGGSNPASLALWTHLPFLRLVRYPGNMGYLALPALSLLIAAGVQRGGRPVILGLLALELTAYGVGSYPLAPRRLFTEAGPLVSRLQAEPPAGRYLLSPLALEAHKGMGVWDWKWRLYGLTNAPFRVRAGGNFGQPLVPTPTYGLMDFLYSQKGAHRAARYLPWAGVGMLLTPKPVAGEPGSPLSHDGRELWEIYRVAGAAPAFFLDEESGESIPAGIPQTAPPPGDPLELDWPREDRFVVSGSGRRPGWAYVAEPRYPGWRVTLDRGERRRPVASVPAFLAFQKVAVPAGDWSLEFRYDPASWRWGVLSTLAGILVLAGFGWINIRDPRFDLK